MTSDVVSWYFLCFFSVCPVNDDSSISSIKLTSLCWTMLIECSVHIVYQCWPISNTTSCQHSCSHRRHCNVVQYRINIMSTSFISNYFGNIVHIVNMLYDIELTSCRHRLPLYTLFTLVTKVDIAMLYDIESTPCWHLLPLITLLTSLTSQSCTMSNQHLSSNFTSNFLVCFLLKIAGLL